MDVKNTFLNGDLHEEVYMVPPPSFDHHPGEVCKLRKAFMRARLSDSKTVDTPIELNARYFASDGSLLSDPSLYRTVVGSLVYLTITCPDIAYDVHIVSQFVTSPTTVHWAAVLRILRYLRSTQFQTLLFSSVSSLELCAYSDADWAGDPTDRKSTTRFYIFVGDSLISWKSMK
ncbi:secreted RxLR effector protein 161-like [Ricinus communis]|uniref:secreted RxLR effector protein 161-like n=1 Tax=Ricinus communis TaxID=3988 RepID=UPI00201AA4EB|nr:secreted RxLR effector protein 161-like [Ricinus communis]